MSENGKNNASKVKLMNAVTYNLKKWMRKLIKGSENFVEYTFLMMRKAMVAPAAKNLNFVLLNT